MSGKVVQKTGRLERGTTGSLTDVGERQPVHRSGHSDVEQATLLFHFIEPPRVDGPGVGERFLLQPADVDVTEFESLRSVEGEEMDGVGSSTIAFESVEAGEIEEFLDGFASRRSSTFERSGKVSQALHLFGGLRCELRCRGFFTQRRANTVSKDLR